MLVPKWLSSCGSFKTTSIPGTPGWHAANAQQPHVGLGLLTTSVFVMCDFEPFPIALRALNLRLSRI